MPSKITKLSKEEALQLIKRDFPTHWEIKQRKAEIEAFLGELEALNKRGRYK